MGIFNRFLSGNDTQHAADSRHSDARELLQSVPVVDTMATQLNLALAAEKAESQAQATRAQQAEAALAQARATADKTTVQLELLDAENKKLKQRLEQLAQQETEFSQVVIEALAAATQGELARRIDITRQQGGNKAIADNLNKLIALFEEVVTGFAASLNAIANGKLTERVTRDYAGSYAVLKNAVNSTIDQLLAVVSEIQGCTHQVKLGAVEISTNNINLSSRTEQQAASLEETSAAMEEITTTVQQNAANAVQANSLARAARETAENGGVVVSKAVAAMQAISDSSNKINEIISVIDEIAFQTNLLALNAAVEAARAGDQGRGFAVVADEVRNLAGRSAKAAKEIKDLIKDSGEKVREGANLVNKSGHTLDEIVTAVKKVNDIVAEISTASDEQATGLDEINRAVSEMDAMTQQNASLVEHAATAGRSLDEQAGKLESLLQFFDTGNTLKASFADRGVARTQRAATPAPGKVVPEAKRPTAKGASSVRATPRTERKPAVRVPGGSTDGEDTNWSEF